MACSRRRRFSSWPSCRPRARVTTPSRVMDTRTATPLRAHKTMPVPVPLPATISPHVTAIAANITAVHPTQAGYLTAGNGDLLRYNEHQPHQAIHQAAPLRAVPPSITDPRRLADLDVRRSDRLGGIVHEYHHAHGLPGRNSRQAQPSKTAESGLSAAAAAVVTCSIDLMPGRRCATTHEARARHAPSAGSLPTGVRSARPTVPRATRGEQGTS